MTREEAIILIKSALKTMYLPKSKEYISDLGYALEIAIKALEQEPRWIPVSERLPYPWDERYLVSLAWGGIGVMEYKSTGFHNYGSFTPVQIESIIAWMSLPEPYEESEET